MRHIYFFALKEDILPVLAEVEQEGALQYVRTGNETSPDFERFHCGADIPNLGVADHETGSVCQSFLVTASTLPVAVRAIRGVGDIPRYCMDQLINPNTVTFTPAGLWADDMVLSGRVATVADSPIAQSLMKRFHAAIRSQFKKIGAFWVGPNARALFEAAKRLGQSAQSPREFDLMPNQRRN